MATARVHATRAMQHIGALPAGVLPSTTDDEPDILLVLNTMLGNWSERRSRADLMARGILSEIVAKCQEAAQLRVIEAAVVSLAAKGAQVALTGSGARTALENAAAAAATAMAAASHLAATETAAIAGLAITAPTALATYATITTDNSYTTGFDDAIQYNLAVAIAAIYKRPIPETVAANAKATYDAVMPAIAA
jgi:hypothetical protein